MKTFGLTIAAGALLAATQAKAAVTLAAARGARASRANLARKLRPERSRPARPAGHRLSVRYAWG